MFKKVIVNTASQVIAKGFTATSTLIVTILIGRALGEAGYGQFTKIFVFIGYFYTLVDFGLNSIYVKYAQDGKEKEHLQVLFTIRIIGALTLAAAACGIAFLLPYNPELETGFSPQVKLGIVLASITIVTHAIFTTTNAYFQKTLTYYYSTLASISSAVVVLASAVAFYFASKGVIAYTASYVLGGISLATIAFFLLIKRLKAPIIPKFIWPEMFNFLKDSWPLAASLVLNIVYFRFDIFILSAFKSSQEVGIYGLAFQFFEASLALPIFFANAIYPTLISSFKKSSTSFTKDLRFWQIFLFIASIFLAFSLFGISYLIPIIYSGSFIESKTALQILSVGIPFFFLSALLWHVFIIYNRQKTLILIYAVGTIFNLSLNWAFIPKYGYLAASTITVASELLIFVLMIIFLLWAKIPIFVSQKNKTNLK